MKFKVSFQLSPNRFCICWVLDVWALNEMWQNRVFCLNFLTILCVKSGILSATFHLLVLFPDQFNSKRIFILQKLCYLFESVDLFIKLVNWSGKRTRKWNVADNIHSFTHKMVRKFGQKTRFCQISFKAQTLSTQHIQKRFGESWKDTLSFIWL